VATTRRTTKADKVVPVEDYEHPDSTRVNNPPAGLAHLDRDETPVRTLSYDPHRDPQMVWAGKVERSEVEVPAPSVHVHEELSAQKIVGSVRRQRLQQPLFDVDKLNPDEAVEFYKHELDWSNRMILGDSLTVMTSLLERERLGGQTQLIFVDPPYGVRYNSNFQPRIGDMEMRDGRDEDLTREPEMIQAYRDTWQLGIHSYLSYLRDRIAVARELLADSGSLIVQISDDYSHLVRVLLDEVFGSQNYVAQITLKKTAGSTGSDLAIVADYLMWYAKDKPQMKYRQLYLPKSSGKATDTAYSWIEMPTGERRRMTRRHRHGRSSRLLSATRACICRPVRHRRRRARRSPQPLPLLDRVVDARYWDVPRLDPGSHGHPGLPQAHGCRSGGCTPRRAISCRRRACCRAHEPVARALPA
jgi:adenine-specific DNA-methyltransferase